MKRFAVTLLMALVPLLMVSCGSDSSSSSSSTPQPDSPAAMTNVSTQAVDAGFSAATGSISGVSGKSGIRDFLQSIQKDSADPGVEYETADGTVHLTGTQTGDAWKVTIVFTNFKTTVEDEDVKYDVTLTGTITYEISVTGDEFGYKYGGTYTLTVGGTDYNVTWDIAMSLNYTASTYNVVGFIAYGGVTYDIDESGPLTEEAVAKKD